MINKIRDILLNLWSRLYDWNNLIKKIIKLLKKCVNFFKFVIRVIKPKASNIKKIIKSNSQ